MIRKLIAATALAAVSVLTFTPAAWSAQQPSTPTPTAPHPRVAPVRTFHAVGTCATVGRVCLAGRAR